MKPIFTIHAGEYLVGSYIEENYKDFNIWIPSKDTGIDLLVTNKDNTRTVSIQIKFSKDFLITHGKKEYQNDLVSCGWWTLNREKIEKSTADLWVMVLHTFNDKNMQYVIIDPTELNYRMNAIHPTEKSLQTYLWVTSKGKCWETRGLKKYQQDLVVEDAFENNVRNFSSFLNNWTALEDKLNT
ncbi:MAG: hypothetical protein KJ990_14330 [Proteobacteria bacterium]|nr:hypothetical protein [Pseudomonadota bacterium]MBU1650558.1 hypothetical protein [Pseudomonadota bacterium]